MLLSDQQNCVLNEGIAIPSLKIGKDACQGDLMFVFIFLLAVNVLFALLKRLKSKKNIKSTKLFDYSFLFSAYAEDSTLYL